MSNFQYESNKILIVLFSSQFSPVALNLVESELNLLCVQSILTVHLHICIYGRALFKQPLSGTDRKHKATSVEERQEQESEEQAEAAEKERKGTSNVPRPVGKRRRQRVLHCNRRIPDNVQSEVGGVGGEVQANATPTPKHYSTMAL